MSAHCHRGQGRFSQRMGERQQAKEHLTSAWTIYRNMSMTHWLTQAEQGAEMKCPRCQSVVVRLLLILDGEVAVFDEHLLSRLDLLEIHYGVRIHSSWATWFSMTMRRLPRQVDTSRIDSAGV